MKKVSYSVARVIPIHTSIVGKLNKKLRDIISDKNEEIYRLRQALERIAKYQTPDQLRQSAGDDYGLDCEEALEVVYENIQEEVKAALSDVSA